MVILDTHYLIWDTLGHSRMSKAELQFLDSQKSLWLCSISLWEVAMLIAKGRIKINVTVEEFVEIAFLKRNYRLLNIDAKVSDVVRQLPKDINGDPADRIISATSILYDATLLTADQNLIASPALNTSWELV